MTRQIALLALGTRGDVQPYIALGKALQAAGHGVRLLAGSSFEPWVRSHGLEFVPSIDIEALMKSSGGLQWTEAEGQRGQLSAMKRLLNQHSEAMTAPMIDLAQTADLVIAGFVSEPFAFALHERYRVPLLIGALQPYLPTGAGWASLVAPFPRRVSVFNRLGAEAGYRLIWNVAADSVNRLRGRIGLAPLRGGAYVSAAKRLPHLFAFSPSVVPQPPDWEAKDRVIGYWFLDETDRYQPDADLVAFIEGGPPPVYIGYGSSTASDPQAKVDQAAAALEQAGQRGIFLAGWSGADPSRAYPHMKVIHGAAHDWLFPRMAALVHHGGAGTTAAGLRAGKPTLIIPHIADQPYWGRRVHELGVGPAPIPRQRATVAALAAAIRAMTSDRVLIERAQQLGAAIRAEDGLAAMVRVVAAQFER